MEKTPQVIIGVAHGMNEIADIFRRRQDQLDVSNAALEFLCGLTAGHVDKVIGPARSKCMGASTLDLLLGGLALKIMLVEDVDQAAVMAERWEGRCATHVRPPNRLAKSVIRRAKPYVVAELASAGGKARWKDVSPEDRSVMMRKLACRPRRKPMAKEAA